jgi:hypothetical protein
MPRYLVERNFGGISDDDMLAAAALSGERAGSASSSKLQSHV